MDSGIYPNEWKIDLIKPIHKKDVTSKETNYRGISLSSCVGKFFNNLILNRLSKSFEELDLFYPHLMGFRPGMRTSNNIFVLDKQFKKGKNLYCCFVDFSKAFDTIWRKGLLAKIKSYGIVGKILNTYWTKPSPTSSLLRPDKVILGEAKLSPILEVKSNKCFIIPKKSVRIRNLKQTVKSNCFIHHVCR